MPDAPDNPAILAGPIRIDHGIPNQGNFRILTNSFNWARVKYNDGMTAKSVFTNAATFLLAQVACFSAAAIGGGFTANSVRTWYPTIAKPEWTPPSWVFGPVWTVLYAMMGLSLWLVWRSGTWPEKKNAVTLFGLQLLLNAAWSIIFFGARSPGFAFAEILLLWIALIATIVAFWTRSKTASLLLVPYLCWSSFAALLNFTIWRMN